MAGDWIKLHRCIGESGLFADDWLTRLWIWCLIRANYGPQTFYGATINAGEFVTSMESAAEVLGKSKSTVWRGLQKLASDDYHCINLRSLVNAKRKFTVVTINNWTTYQSSESPCETGAERERNGSGTGAEQIEEGKKERKKEENKEPPNPQGGKSSDVTADSLTYPEGFDTPEVRQAVEQWLSYKRSRRQAYKTAATAQQIWKTADWKSIGPDGFIAAVGRSIGNNYQGIFPDKSFQPKQKAPLKTDNGESFDAYFDKLAAE